MPPHRRSSRRLHPALSLLLALGLHAGVFVGLGSISVRPPAPASSVGVAAPQLEIALETETDTASNRDSAGGDSAQALDAAGSTLAPPAAAPSGAPTESQARSRARESARRNRADRAAGEIAALPESDGAAASANEEEPGAGVPGTVPPGAAPAPRIDLGLNDGIRRAALAGGWLEPIAPPQKPTDGGLREGLAALDAQRGLSLSGPANHAAYEAARLFAPRNGMGVFDILTDEHGVVLSVKLASAPNDEDRWQRVGQQLEQILKDRRLRVPAGAKGLEA